MGSHGAMLSRARGKSERGVELGDGTTFGSGRYLDEAPSTRGAEARSMEPRVPFGAHRRTPGVRRSAHFDALKWHIWLGFSSWRYNKVC